MRDGKKFPDTEYFRRESLLRAKSEVVRGAAKMVG